MMDPSYDGLIARATVEELARRPDELGAWALEMISATDEEAVFLRGARVFFTNYGIEKRRAAVTFLAETFSVKRADMKRYLLFKGLVGPRD